MNRRAPDKLIVKSRVGRHLHSAIKNKKALTGKESKIFLANVRRMREDVYTPERFAREKKKVLRLVVLANKKGFLPDYLVREAVLSIASAEKIVQRNAEEARSGKK